MADGPIVAPSADDIFGRVARPTDDRPSMTPLIDAAGLSGLDNTATPEHVESGLARLRLSLPADLDALSRETLRADLRRRLTEQGAPVTAPMIAAAVAAPVPTRDDDDRPRRSQASKIVDLALDAGVDLWHAPTGDAYVTLPAGSHREHHKLTSRNVRDWLARRFYEATNGAPGSQAIADACAVLAGKARYDGAMHAPAVRVAGDGSSVYLDLGDDDWRAVEVTTAGWRIVTDPPVRFLRSRGLLALPEPTCGSAIDACRDVMHIASDDDWRLLTAWQMGALRPNGPYPVATLVGEQGSGKSTVGRMLRRAIDPHAAELRTEPRAIEDVMIAAARSRIVAFDNLSSLPAWLSDALCQVATGGTLTKRELYTSDDEVIIEACRPVLLTSIADVVTRGDLLDRAIVVTLPTITATERRSEADLWRAFGQAAPGMLGALLDAVASSLARESVIQIDRLPRVSDWAIWTTAAEPGLGWPDGSILAAYWRMRDGAVLTNLDGDSVAAAIRQLALPWQGTATELLARLAPAGRAPRGWPESARAMSAALRRLAPGLRAAGIDVVTGIREANTGGRRLIEIQPLEDSRDSASPSSLASLRPEPLGTSSDANADADRDRSSLDSACVYRQSDASADSDDGPRLFSDGEAPSALKVEHARC